MRIGLVGAMDCEIAVRECFENPSQQVVRKNTFYLGDLSGHEVVAVCGGVGIVNGALAAQILIEHFHVDCVINPGVAGAVSPELDLCDVVVSSDSIYWDLGMEPLKNLFPFLPGEAFPADAQMQQRCMQACAKAIAPKRLVVGRVASGQRFVDDLETKMMLNQKMGAVCVEMEGAGVAHACHLTDTPYLIIRSISDTIRHNGADGLMTFQTFLKVASQQISNALLALLEAL